VIDYQVAARFNLVPQFSDREFRIGRVLQHTYTDNKIEFARQER
jgi:hypothetical protein